MVIFDNLNSNFRQPMVTNFCISSCNKILGPKKASKIRP